MAKSSKFYVVWKGKTPGIYNNWNSCKAQVEGFLGASYKSYPSMKEAQKALQDGPQYKPESPSISKKVFDYSTIVEKNSISVDAACSGNPGDMEYQGVVTLTKMELFHFGPIKMGTNNIGEFLAIVHALAMFKQKGNEESSIYTDSKTAMSWVRKKKANTKLFEKHNNPELQSLVSRAELWLQKNTFKNRIIKWDTKNWGEIPADFGRK